MWIHVPRPISRSPRESQDSISVLTPEAAERLAQSAMWRSKHRPAAYWLRVWPKVRCLQLLSGLTSEPSQMKRQENGVEQWTDLWRDIRASRSASPDVVEGSTTRAISGPTSSESLRNATHGGASLKMFPDISDGDTSQMSSQTLKALVSDVRSKSSKRLKSALRISESDSSFLPWRSPDTNKRGGSTTAAAREAGGHQVNLQDQVFDWVMAAMAWDAQRTMTSDGALRRVENNKPVNGKQTLELSTQVIAWQAAAVEGWENWPTILAADAYGHEYSSTSVHLPGAVQQWATATASDGERVSPNMRGNPTLPSQAKDWATLSGLDGGQRSRGGKRKSELLLGGQATEWADQQLSMDLVVEEMSSLPPEMTGVLGSKLREMGIRFRLNPQFVEWLMGMPVNWVSPEPNN